MLLIQGNHVGHLLLMMWMMSRGSSRKLLKIGEHPFLLNCEALFSYQDSILRFVDVRA
ncbi:hypothetical protein CK203_021964 [Vitis vinifera]|uniref:Uncharacterized protein n=1 Tax=Vitis vinifera TaxID=29760 RepID=A0A438JFQ0_VITVI|nr:hypothetical protein CK203_074309 [Vitis vinifera]RVX07785.1 hypothetical protein CK203_021964 [Vitis vinifera]